LEEVFILYLLGMKSSRKAAPRRYTFPPTRRQAKEWVIPEGRQYTSWSADAVRARAERFFHGGKPFSPAIQSSINIFNEAKTIRNAIAHESDSARDKFNNLARDLLGGTLPTALTPGGLLIASVPNSTPRQTYLELYLQKFKTVACAIVPT
jgi:hypothetical protein